MNQKTPSYLNKIIIKWNNYRREAPAPSQASPHYALCLESGNGKHSTVMKNKGKKSARITNVAF